MKRLLSIILAIILLLPCIVVNAEENQKFYSVNFDIGNGEISKKVIIKKEEIYLAANDFSDITRYAPNEDGTMFLVKGQELKKAFKSVVINKKDKKILVSGTHLFDLTDYFEIEGSTYLPLSQMLPILNAEIYEVKDNTIYISNNKLSLAEVLYDFDIADFYFNMSTEFNDSAWLASWFIVPNYILNTIVDVRFDRLDIITHTGDYKDYKDIFSEFLADDNLYLKAKAQEDDIIGTTIDFFTKSNSTAKDMKDVYDWVETASKTEIDSKTGGALLDSLKAYYDSGELKADDLKGLNDAWTKGDISFADCIEAVSYIYTYMNQVEDNRKMLDAVYNVNASVSSKDAERKAAKQVYNLYGDKVILAISQEIIEKIADDVVKDYINPIAIYTATAKVAGVVLENVLPFSPSDISKLTLYSNTVLSASSKYYEYDTSTDKSTENLRLSLLLCLTASKKCFSIIDEVAKGTNNDDKYYKNKIDKIEQLIMGLYIASDNLKLDSFEHYEEYKKSNIEKIKSVTSNPQSSIILKTGKYAGIFTGWERGAEIQLKKCDENEVLLNIFLPRIGDVEVLAMRNGNVATFEGDISGTLMIIDDETIEINVVSDKTGYNSFVGLYNCDYLSEEEQSKQQDNYCYMVLLMNDKNKGSWRIIENHNNIGSYYDQSRIHIHFLQDKKTVKYYIAGESLGGDTPIDEYSATYYIKDQIIYIGKNAYELYAYTAGSSTMRLTALNKYDIDLSGEYILDSNFWAQGVMEF